jgi:hypothetical protein
MAAKVPDTLGDSQRASLVVAKLATLQQEAFNLELDRVAAGKDPSSSAPVQAREDGSQPTYKERLDELRSAQEQIVAENSDLEEAIRSLAEVRKGAGEV